MPLGVRVGAGRTRCTRSPARSVPSDNLPDSAKRRRNSSGAGRVLPTTEETGRPDDQAIGVGPRAVASQRERRTLRVSAALCVVPGIVGSLGDIWSTVL